MTVERRNQPAPFARIKHTLRDELARGRWPTGGLMPSEADLVARFGVSRMTVNRALRELQQEGLIDRVKGLGTFAAPLHRVSSTLTLRDLQEEIESRGSQNGRACILPNHQAREFLQSALRVWNFTIDKDGQSVRPKRAIHRHRAQRREWHTTPANRTQSTISRLVEGEENI